MFTFRAGSACLLLTGLAVVAAACGGGTTSGSDAALPTHARSGAVTAAPVHGGPAPASGDRSSGDRSADGGSAGDGSAGDGDLVGSSAGASTAARRADGAQALGTQTIGATVAPATADIVEDGTLDVTYRTAAELRGSYSAISGLAAASGGFVSASTLTNARRPTASLTVRVPDDEVRVLIARIGTMGHVTSQTLSGHDETGEVVDLSVEITNLTSEEAAVRKLLGDTGSVRDILTVQQQLFQLQDEIQQLQAQSNSLADQIQYATVTVQLSTVAPPPVHHHRRRHHAASTISRFWHLASSHSVGVVRSVFLAIGWAAPAILAFAVLGGAWLVLRRRHTPTPAAATTDETA